MSRLFPNWTITRGRVLISLIVAAALVHFLLTFPAFVKGDEFRFLSDIYSLNRGTLRAPFQRFRVHLFRWLPAVDGDETHQIMVARVRYFILLLGSCGLLCSLSRAFLSLDASLFAVLCLLSFGRLRIPRSVHPVRTRALPTAAPRASPMPQIVALTQAPEPHFFPGVLFHNLGNDPGLLLYLAPLSLNVPLRIRLVDGLPKLHT